MNKKISVCIVDDHSLVIAGLQNLLRNSDEVVISGEYLTGKDLMDGLEQSLPDVILMDILLPDINGKELALMVRHQYPEVKIIALSSLDAPTHVKAMMRNGCQGYLLKNARKEVLIEAIKKVYEGEQFIESGLKKKMLNSFLNFQNRQKKELSNLHNIKLTKREKEILAMIVKENTNHDIAGQLYISVRTVEFHKKNLLQKLDVKSTLGLLKAALDMGLTDVD